MNQYKNKELIEGIAIIAKQLRSEMVSQSTKGDASPLSQMEVINDIKINHNINIHLGRIETARSNISVSQLSLLCTYYQIKLSEFMVLVEDYMENELD